jgi:hypothetical protein
LLAAGLVLAFHALRLGGWEELFALDGAPGTGAKRYLYLPSNHPELP